MPDDLLHTEKVDPQALRNCMMNEHVESQDGKACHICVKFVEDERRRSEELHQKRAMQEALFA